MLRPNERTCLLSPARAAWWLAVLGAVLTPATLLSQAGQIHVGRNVHVSQGHANYSLGEVLLSADPDDANHLLGCGVVYGESENRRWTVAYVSTDGGKTWNPTLETKHFEDSADEACALGRNGVASYITIGFTDVNRDHPTYALGVYRSADGGMTWTQHEDIPLSFQSLDRESLTIDLTHGPFANRVYVTGVSQIADLHGSSHSGFAVWYSRDGGVTFQGPFKRVAGGDHYLLDIGNSVVLSDGKLVSIFGDLKDSTGSATPANVPGEANAVLESITTTAGGASLSQATKVDDFFMLHHEKGLGISTVGIPTLAVDPGDGPFHGRLYTTWADGRDGRSAIRFAYSTDQGKTWSKSTAIDDVAGPVYNETGPENFLSTVAVNRAGVVVVTWYDRRDNRDGLGWYVRTRASLDGGETWLPSVRVSEKPNTFAPGQTLVTGAAAERAGADPGNVDGGSPTHVAVLTQGRQFFAGDYAGLAADAGGTFHAFWIDDRTGLAQIWTAAIVVDGIAVRNGDAELADLRDVSDNVEVKVVSSAYDRVSNMVTIGVRLKNSSKKAITGALKVRLVDVVSSIGTPAAANADNHLSQPGAVWDLSSSVKDGVLKPGDASDLRQLVFRVTTPLKLLERRSVRYRLLDFDVRVLAGKVGD